MRWALLRAETFQHDQNPAGEPARAADPAAGTGAGHPRGLFRRAGAAPRRPAAAGQTTGVMNWLPAIFTKRAPERSPQEEPFSPIYVVGGQPVRYLSQGAIKTAEEAQKKSPQLYRITNFIASAVQSVPWYCEV